MAVNSDFLEKFPISSLVSPHRDWMTKIVTTTWWQAALVMAVKIQCEYEREEEEEGGKNLRWNTVNVNLLLDVF